MKTINALLILATLVVAPFAHAKESSHGPRTRPRALILPSHAGQLVKGIERTVFALHPETLRHSQQVGVLAGMLAKAKGMNERGIKLASLAGVLHDVGKSRIDEQILTKAGRLTDPEFDLIRKHPKMGVEVMKRYLRTHPNSLPRWALRSVNDAILYHHERWDGGGYPHGLKGRDIPRIARLLTVVDSFDAMTSARKSRMSPGIARNGGKTERKAKTLDEAWQELQSYSRKQFDHQLVAAFARVAEEIERAGGLAAFWAGSIGVLELPPGLTQISQSTALQAVGAR